ncbi:hypothetical protein HOD88_03575 [archaeon]|jgi:hypothetical protein|nr:hypothetical protein [archaeon]
MIGIEVIAIIILGVILLILLILKFIESHLSKEVVIAKTKRDELYQKELDNLNLTEKDTMKKIDSIARNFFYEAYNFNMKEYSEMEEKFKEMKNKNGIKFCKIMEKNDYSTEEITSEEKEKLKGLLREITKKTHIISKIETPKEELIKKEKLKKTKATEDKKEIKK